MAGDIVLSVVSSSWTYWLSAAIGVVSLVLYFWIHRAKKPLQRHPTIPGPAPTHPELGNLPDLQKAGSLPEYLTVLHKQYGPIVSFWWGTELNVTIASPRLFKQVAKLFNRPFEQFKLFEPILTKYSLALTNDDEGRRRHAAYSRCYNQGNLKNYFKIFQQLGEDLVVKWLTTAGKVMDLQEEMFAVAIKGLSKTSFGQFFYDEKEIHTYYHHHQTCWDEMELQMIEGPPEPGSKRAIQYEQSINVLHDSIRKAMKCRKELGRNDGEEEALIDVIMEVADNDITKLGDAVNFFWAGTHTSGMFLTWSLYYLAKHPECQEKMYQELCEVLGENLVDNDNIQQLIYCRQVFDEILRCSTVVSFAGRYSDTECTLEDHIIPAKTPVFLAMGVVMEDENLWSNPHRFDPERFSPSYQTPLPPYAFEPFGFAGKRKCPAYKFTLVEATTVFSVLLRKFKIQLVDDGAGYVTKIYTIVPTPKDKIYFRAEKRVSI